MELLDLDISQKKPYEKEDAIIVKGVSKYFKLPMEKKITIYQNFAGVLNRHNNKYEKFWALKDVSFTVKRGETVGVIGSNGSGKSTLLKIIAGVLYPDTGKVKVNGKIAPFLELGVGFQPELTAEDNVYLYGSIMGMNKREVENKVESIFKFAELEKFRNVKLKNFSSGMYARLAFSTAISADPDILLVDEALSVGDEAFQIKCFDKINEFKRSGKTIVFVSHGMGTIQQICDRAVLLDHGMVQSTGYSEMVINDYHNAIRAKDEVTLKEYNEEIAEEKLLEPVTEPVLIKKDAVKQNQSSDSPIKDRWGSKEIEIIDVKFLDKNGNERYTFETAEPMTVRMRYMASQNVSQPVFGMAIYRNDGVHVNGTNAKLHNRVPDSLSGEGWVDYIIRSLPLLVGTYFVTAVIYDYQCVRPYDHHEKRFSFKVTTTEIKDPGLMYIPCEWVYSK